MPTGLGPDALFILLELPPEPLVGLDQRPPLLDDFKHGLEPDPQVLHHVRQDNGGRPGLARMAVHQDIPAPLPVLPYPLRALAEVLVDLVVFGVRGRNELVVDVQGGEGLPDLLGPGVLQERLARAGQDRRDVVGG